MKFINDLKTNASAQNVQISELQNKVSTLVSEAKKKEEEIKVLKQEYSESFKDETLDQVAVLEAEIIKLKAKASIVGNATPTVAKGTISVTAADIVKDVESEVARLGLHKKRENIDKQFAILFNTLTEYKNALDGLMEERQSIVEVKSCFTKETIDSIQCAFDMVGSSGDMGTLESHNKFNDIKELFLEISGMCAQLTYCINR